MSSAYITVSDLRPSLLSTQQLVQLTQDVPASNDIDETVLASAIEEAQSEVDAYIGARLQVPLATPPTLVRRLTARLTVHVLYSRRPGATSEERDKDRADVLRTLRDISRGVVTLGVQPEATANSETIIRVDGAPKMFGRSNLKGF